MLSQSSTMMNLVSLLLLIVVVAANGSIGQATSDEDVQSSRPLHRPDVVASMRIFLQQVDRPSNRRLLERVGKRTPTGLFKYVIATGKLPDDFVVKSGNSETDPDIFGPLRTARKKQKYTIDSSDDEKQERRGPDSVSHIFGGRGGSIAHPSPTSIVFVPTLSGKSSGSEKGSGKSGKANRPGSVASLFTRSPVTVSATATMVPSTASPSRSPTFSVETYGKGSGKGKASGKGANSSGKGAEGSGKGAGRSGKGNGSVEGAEGSPKGKAAKKGESESEKASKKRSKGGKSGGKGKGKSRCDRFEFDADRRRLQFDGANCGNEFLDVAAQISDLTIFLDLIEASGLSFMFSCAGPFTIAAPVNSAFDGIDISNFSKSELKDIVLHHVFPGITLKDDIENGAWEALNGAKVISMKDPLRLNDARPVQTDILGCNFVAHTIDDLLVDLGK
jgi:Fasciclin domain